MGNSHEPPDTDGVPIDVACQIDALCDQFEAALSGADAPLLAGYLNRVDARGRKRLLEELAGLALEHLAKQNVADPAATLLAANAHLRDELRPFLAHAAITVPHADTDTPRKPFGRGLHVRCPNCHNPIELVPDAELESIHCPSCGSDFSLMNDDVETRAAREISQVGHFKLVERVGIGAFGSVWKALDTELDRTVAVKIPRQGNLDGQQREAFLREARSAAQLRHPNIVPVHEVGRDGDSLYIVSDFVRGITLSDWLSGQQLTPREAAELCVKIAEALHHAHEHGVIHRDLKPGNIMIDAEGEPHVMDFGLAKRDAGEITMTMDGQVLGTPAYMSPEQALGEAHTADRRSDVYSLGVILFQLLTGELPFRGNARMIMHQVIHDEPPSPRKLNSNVPRDLETITLKCLEKDAARRYPSALELSADLRRFLSGESILASPTSRHERMMKWIRRNRTATAATAAVALTLITGTTISTYFAVDARRQAAIAISRQQETEFARRDAAARQKESEKARVEEALARQQADESRIAQSIEVERSLTGTRAMREAEALVEFLVEAFERHDRVQDSPTFTVVEVMDRVEKQLAESSAIQGLSQAKLLTAIGQSRIALGQSSKAIEPLRKAKDLLEWELWPDHPDMLQSLTNLVRAYRTAGRPDDAIQLVQQMLNDDLYFQSLEVATVVGADALIDAAKAETAGQVRNPIDAVVVGELKLIAGDYDSAEKTLRSAIQRLFQPAAYSYKSLGWCLLAQGKVNEAKEAFELALQNRRTKDGEYNLKGANIVEMTAAYFLDLITEEQYVAHAARSADEACFPFLYIGQRREFEGDKQAAIAAYEKCNELGSHETAHSNVALARYRLARLRETAAP